MLGYFLLGFVASEKEWTLQVSMYVISCAYVSMCVYVSECLCDFVSVSACACASLIPESLLSYALKKN